MNCAHCAQPTQLQCSGCYRTGYCNVICQRLDYPRHVGCRTQARADAIAREEAIPGVAVVKSGNNNLSATIFRSTRVVNGNELAVYIKFPLTRQEYQENLDFLQLYQASGRVPELLEHNDVECKLVMRAEPYRNLKEFQRFKRKALSAEQKQAMTLALIEAFNELSPRRDYVDMSGNVSNIGVRETGDPVRPFHVIFFEGGANVRVMDSMAAVARAFISRLISTDSWGNHLSPLFPRATDLQRFWRQGVVYLQ